jgi:hypothetical protein
MARQRKAAQALVGALVVVSSTFGCGGGGPGDTASADQAEPETQAAEPDSSGGGGMAVEGVLGSIPEHRVEQVMARNMERLEECYGDALDSIDVIEGAFELVIVVDLDGSVYQTYMRDGNLGSLEAESCMLQQIMRFKFPEPGGGRAEVSHQLQLEAPYDPPEPIDWSGSEIAEVVGQHRDDLERCLGGRTGVQLTVYVGTGGKVVSAGATASEYEMYEAAVCLARAAAAWVFADPGAQTAKASVSF